MASKRKEKGNEDEIAARPDRSPRAGQKKRAAKAKRAANDDDEAEELDDEYAELEAEEDAADFAPRSVGAWRDADRWSQRIGDVVWLRCGFMGTRWWSHKMTLERAHT